MLYLDIQKGEEATKKAKYQQQIGGTEVCIKRLIMDTKGCGQLMSNGTYFSDRWFSGVKMDEEAIHEGVYYCRPLKMIHKCFCIATL